jgi:hypothetical protein
MNRFTSIALTAVIVVMLTAASLSASVSHTFPLHSRNGSKMSGEVTLATAIGPGGRPAVSVTIRLSGVFIPEAEFPAGVYAGSCRDVLSEAPEWKLNSVKNGESTTVLYGQSVSSLELAGYSIVVSAETHPSNTLACASLSVPVAVNASWVPAEATAVNAGLSTKSTFIVQAYVTLPKPCYVARIRAMRLDPHSPRYFLVEELPPSGFCISVVHHCVVESAPFFFPIPQSIDADSLGPKRWHVIVGSTVPKPVRPICRAA